MNDSVSLKNWLGNIDKQLCLTNLSTTSGFEIPLLRIILQKISESYKHTKAEHEAKECRLQKFVVSVFVQNGEKYKVKRYRDDHEKSSKAGDNFRHDGHG